MTLNHIGIINKSEEDASDFYGDFLGFELTREFIVPPDLSIQIFNIKESIKVLVFENHGIKLEVFISPEFRPACPDLMHPGFFFDNLSEVLEKAGQNGVEVITGSTKDKTVYFLRDFSGNLIEIKETPPE
jgi:catechol 2,3-dioxygenase-like lactoylglutathione lyase family enzyme